MTHLLQFTINLRKSHHQRQCTLQRLCEDHVLFVWGDLDVYLCWQQHPKCLRTFHLLYPHFFFKMRPSSKPTKKKKKPKERGAPYSNSSISVITHMFEWISLLIMKDTITSPDIDPSSWIIVYTLKEARFEGIECCGYYYYNYYYYYHHHHHQYLLYAGYLYIYSCDKPCP